MTVPALSPPIWGLVFVLCASALLWLLSLRLKDASIADIFWGIGVAGVADIAAWLGQSSGTRASAVLLLVNLWGIRLALHIFARHRAARYEDRRYAAMRQHYGRRWWWLSLLQVFLLQAVLIWFVPAPAVAALLYAQRPMAWLDYAGITIAALGLIIETLSDSQLAAFKADPANKRQVMDKGLWGWSRHPNYFGEALTWWGLFLVGFSASHQYWLLLSPILVTTLLLYVSGVTLMEDGISDRRPGYAAYKRRVSAFIPWPPRT